MYLASPGLFEMECIIHLGDFGVDIFLPLLALIPMTLDLRSLSPNSAHFFGGSGMILKLNILEVLLYIFLGLVVVIVVVDVFMDNCFG